MLLKSHRVCQSTLWNSVINSNNSSLAPALSHFPPTKANFVTRFPSANSSIHHLLSVYLTTALAPSFLRSLPLQCFGCSPVAMKRSQQWPFSVREHHSKRNAYFMMACFDKGNYTVSSQTVVYKNDDLASLRASMRCVQTVFAVWLSIPQNSTKRLWSQWWKGRTVFLLAAVHADLCPPRWLVSLVIIWFFSARDQNVRNKKLYGWISTQF